MKNSTQVKKREYYLGLDIGTDSVGYAVTDKEYGLCKFKGEPMWGVTTFEAANQSEERRTHRTSRRRGARKVWRINLLSELFAKEIAKVDERFFIRLKESGLYRDDVSDINDRHIFFNDEGYNDSDYFKEYPTIHHLINELMTGDEPHDVRLVYLACAWLVAHRGHFLSDLSKENIDVVNNFPIVYKGLMDHFTGNDFDMPWECDASTFLGVLNMKTGVSGKEKKFGEILFGGKIPKEKAENFDDEQLEKHPYNIALIIKLLCGGKVAPKDLYFITGEQYSELTSFTLGMSDEEFLQLMENLGDDYELIKQLKAVYDAVTLIDLLNGESRISVSKVNLYNQHAEDLKNLKYIIKNYAPKKYNEVFREVKKSTANYVAYSYNTKGLKKSDLKELKKVNKEDFCKYIKGILKGIVPTEKDVEMFEDITLRLETNSFMPKQKDTDNRVIPYQLYYVELEDILKKASGYLPFLSEKDENGISCADKIKQIFEFRIPYYVGPLHKDEKVKSNAWIVRKPGKITPWNFDEKVDLDACEEEFIKRLINKCTYLPAEDVLPKSSLLYSKFCVLNEINNIKIDGKEIPVELKQKIYNEVFMFNPRVTRKKIKDYCISNGFMDKKSVLDGVDINLTSTLKPWMDFRRLLESGTLTEADAEEIIKRSTYSDNKYRFKLWLHNHYPMLTRDDISYLASKPYKDFGRISRKLLCELYGTEKKGYGEAFTIIEGMWETNNNLMQFLSDKYTFADEIENIRKEHYSDKVTTLSERLDSMYISNAVKRPIIRTLDIISDVVKVKGGAPAKIFVEMARGAEEEQRNKRTQSRREKINDLYNSIKNEDISALRAELESMGEYVDNRLQSERLYLYFMQLGKCMYSGEAIDIVELMNGSKNYDVDHIYPQCLVKDDSIHNNKVLVLSRLNGEKGDKYPIKSEIQSKMAEYWDKLKANGLISDEKYKRLTRKSTFTDDELMGFINRQLVETRQSTKAVATLLREKFPETDIVYVKAGLVSDFRHQYSMLKSRTVNDLHHAKDAYLNIVVGNVYDNKFSKKWFKLSDTYSMKTENLFKYPVNTPSGELMWSGENAIGIVKKNYSKNRAHITRYAFCRKGGLFDQMPLKAAEGLISRKSDMPTEKYGGYNKPTASFFSLVKFTNEKKSDIIIMPVDLIYAERYKNDETFREYYAKGTIQNITNKPVIKVEFPLGDRVIKVNTLFEIDGFRMCLGYKSGGGKQLGFLNIVPFTCRKQTEEYIRQVEKFNEKIKKNESYKYDVDFSYITVENNIELYELYIDKLSSYPYNKRPASPLESIVNGKDKFVSLSIKEQIKCLISIHSIFGRLVGGTDLTYIGGVGRAGNIAMSSTLSNWTKNYKEIYIIDQSASGLFEKKSCNLLDLL